MWGEPRRHFPGIPVPYFYSRGEPSLLFCSRGRPPISTHSPRVGRTLCALLSCLLILNFNSLAPRGANQSLCVIARKKRTFQLTRPAWGEPQPFRRPGWLKLISTHSPRVGRTRSRVVFSPRAIISTHSPRVGRTLIFFRSRVSRFISTHSPRVGRTR